jgi:hypothetical protein
LYWKTAEIDYSKQNNEDKAKQSRSDSPETTLLVHIKTPPANAKSTKQIINLIASVP